MPHKYTRPDLFSLAQTLRKNATDAESLLWAALRNKQLGVKFRRQQPIGDYIVDFVCSEKKLIIEADGSQHVESITDADRTHFLEKQGYTVLRFWNHEILQETTSVLENIYALLFPPTESLRGSTPPPGGSNTHHHSSLVGLEREKLVPMDQFFQSKSERTSVAKSDPVRGREEPNWLSSGYEHIWLPYTQMQAAPEPLPVVGAEGCLLHLDDGRSLIDGISSWWSVCHGHNHPHIREAMVEQTERFTHVMFAGLAHEPAYILAERLSKITPEGLTRCFFSDSGSTAVEVALKMALQYWRNHSNTRKNKFICFEGGYHGDTFGAMAVSGRGGMHMAFESLLPRHYTVPLPNDEYSFAEFSDLLADISSNVAGLIMEPLVQGAGGMRFHSADILAEIRRVCREHEILFITDEIMTGFGRLGSMFACDEAGISPDIMCLGKGLTGGAMTLGATMATADVFEAFLDDDIGKALMHGPTFMGSPLACAAANASLDLFEQEPRLQQAEAIEKQLREELSTLAELTGVVDIRCKGALGVVQLEATMDDMFAIRPKLLKHNVWLRPFHDVIYIMPPLVISPEELLQLTRAVCEVVTEWSTHD